MKIFDIVKKKLNIYPKTFVKDTIEWTVLYSLIGGTIIDFITDNYKGKSPIGVNCVNFATRWIRPDDIISNIPEAVRDILYLIDKHNKTDTMYTGEFIEDVQYTLNYKYLRRKVKKFLIKKMKTGNSIKDALDRGMEIDDIELYY